MWLVNLFPEWIFNALFALGIVGFIGSFFLSLIPVISNYKLLVQSAAIALISLGAWYSGSANNEARWQAKQKKFEEDMAIAEEMVKQTNARVEYVFLDRIKTVKDVQVILQDRIVNIAEKIDSQCKITKDSIEILNDAAQNKAGALK